MDGLPEGAKPSLTIQLSSPVEDGQLNVLHDPLNTDPAPEGAFVVFRGVETTVATLSLTAMDADILLGLSAPHEVAPLCALDPMDIKDKYVTELPVAIVGHGSATSAVSSVSVEEATATSVEVEEGVAAAGEESSSTKDIVADEVVAIQPICVVTLRITYRPSPKDQREELYELLNKTSLRKATALENLRIISLEMAATRSASGGAESGDDPSSGGNAVPNKPAVKPGFLNAKSKKNKEESRIKQFYNRALGPDSILRKGAFLALFLKDYIIFFGAVTFFHYQGQMLALPPPV